MFQYLLWVQCTTKWVTNTLSHTCVLSEWLCVNILLSQPVDIVFLSLFLSLSVHTEFQLSVQYSVSVMHFFHSYVCFGCSLIGWFFNSPVIARNSKLHLHEVHIRKHSSLFIVIKHLNVCALSSFRFNYLILWFVISISCSFFSPSFGFFSIQSVQLFWIIVQL